MKKNPNMKRVVFGLLALVLLIPLLVIAYQLFSDPSKDYPSVPPEDPAAQVIRGEYLAKAGNCMACHTVRGGKQYAGGRAISTPFGDIYASNLTSDAKTGIGSWTSDDFWRALHNGKSKDGSFLYPAFPYPNYTKVTRADSDALFAYLRTVPAVSQENEEHDLRFPYNQRMLLAFWRALYFEPGIFEADKKQSAEWNRGAYLVQGLGHCAACHTARNALGGTTGKADLAGGMIPMLNWHAASLTSDAEAGLGAWTVKDISDLLKTGVSQRGAVFGPMAEVVSGSLQHLSQSDVNAMAIYLKELPKSGDGRTLEKPSLPATGEETLKLGAQLYEKHCVECHKADGKGVPPGYPPLAGNESLSANSPLNPIRIVLNGGYPPSTGGNPRPYGMPPFGPVLNDAEVAAVVSYVRTAWENKGSVVSPFDVGRLRGVPIE